MKIKNIDWALFTGFFVGIIIFITEFFFPDTSSLTSIIVAGLAAFIGGLIGYKLFPKARDRRGNHGS
ncbi:hypothetical protein [Virgibacillus ainsalahensis]